MQELGAQVIIKMRKEDIAFFSSLMSTYEGVGIVRTLSSKEGVIEVLTTKDMLDDLHGLIDSLKDEYNMQVLESYGEEQGVKK